MYGLLERRDGIMNKEHHCEKWDKLEGPIEISDDGSISQPYVDYDDSWTYGHNIDPFEFCPYCGVKL